MVPLYFDFFLHLHLLLEVHHKGIVLQFSEPLLSHFLMLLDLSTSSELRHQAEQIVHLLTPKQDLSLLSSSISDNLCTHCTLRPGQLHVDL